jgi:hypothetical protein
MNLRMLTPFLQCENYIRIPIFRIESKFKNVQASYKTRIQFAITKKSKNSLTMRDYYN